MDDLTGWGVESLPAVALAELDEMESWRHLLEVAAHLAHSRRMLGYARRGVRVAPLYRRTLAHQLAHETGRREALGDPTWRVWAAWSESAALGDAVAAIEAAGL